MAIVTFETLREVQRKEKKSENLAELTDEFYSGAKEYFERAAKSDANEVRNARSILEDIVDRREKKILNQAMRAVRLREKPDLSGMTSREREFFNQLLENIKNFREGTDLNGGRIELKEAKKSRAEDIEELIEHEKEISEHPNYVKVKVLEDIPEIIGADLKDYGPFKSGEVVQLPKENADLFVNRGKAELV